MHLDDLLLMVFLQMVRCYAPEGLVVLMVFSTNGSVLRTYKWSGATHLGDLLLMGFSTNGSRLRTLGDLLLMGFSANGLRLCRSGGVLYL